MKQLYFTKPYKKAMPIKLVSLFVFLFLCTTIGYSQVRVPFAPRASIFTPTQKNYTIKGDFMMIGNTNLQLAGYTYPSSQSNANDMRYVDIDNDANTWNSSSANLTFSTENGAIPDCSKIIYAGLYWTGRAFGEVEVDPGNTFQVTKTVSGGATVTKTFDKRKVSLKGPSQSSYTEFEATGISFPPNGEDRNMYSAYADVTEYVRENGIGEYFVADIAIREGSVDATGYYGGWGMVVVYENSKMKWRDITVFDGHAYVNNNAELWPINISGFNATQNGDVNLKLGVMAGEGDIQWKGDTFQMLRQDTGVYETLSYTSPNESNTSNNFFNSTITTGGNSRNPNHNNNTGLDIIMFDVDNANNKYIANNQTSTSFQYGSGDDTYVIFNITFSVDAYIPEPEAILTTTSVNTNGSTPGVLFPGETADYKIEIKNKGTETTDNTIITLPVPYTSSYEELSIKYNIYPPFATTAVPYYDPNAGATGSIIWNLGTLPVPDNPEDILADLSFTLTATTDCSLLVNPSCTPSISLDGKIAGIGSTSSTTFNQSLIVGYQTSGFCIGEPIPTPSIVNIDAEAYIAANCGSYIHVRDFYFCNIGSTPIQTSQISAAFPEGTRFYNEYPKNNTSIEYNASNPFPATLGTTLYYGIPPGTTLCYYEFNIEVTNIDSVPTVQDVSYCLNETASALTATPSDAPISPSAYTLYYYVDNDPSTPAQTSIVPSTSVAGETTYYVAEGYSNSCISQTRVPIKVTVFGGTPEITAPATINIEGCDENNITALTARYPYSSTQSADIKDTFVATDYTAIGNETIASITYIDAITPDSSCPIIVTRTFTITNDCGITASVEQIININDNTAPTGTAPTGVTNADVCSANAQTAYPFDATTIASNYSDNCGGTISVNLTNTTQTGDDCSWSLVYTYEVLDICGNKLENQTITHSGSDQSAPTGTAPTGVTNADECSANALTAYPFDATTVATNYTDSCSAVTVNLIDTNLTGDDCSWSLVYTYEVVDTCGNKLENQTITHSGSDQSAPTGTAPLGVANADVCSASASTAYPFDETTVATNYTDICDATVTVNLTNTTLTGDDCSWSLVYTFEVVDACGNKLENQTITHSGSDQSAPTGTAPTGVTNADNCSANALTAYPFDETTVAANYTDNCSGIVTVNLTNTALTGDDCSWSLVYTYEVVDTCGNKLENQTITHTGNDQTAPTINNTNLSNIVIECGVGDTETTLNTWLSSNAGATATDNCSTVTWSNNYGSDTSVKCDDGAVTVVFTATDACDNKSTITATYLIKDNVVPIITNTLGELDRTLECSDTDGLSEALALAPSATDDCSIPNLIVISDVTTTDPVCLNAYVRVRVWNFVDACGNTSTNYTQTIIVQDTTPPAFVGTLPPIALTAECDAIPTAETLTATDNCGDATVSVQDVKTNGSCPNNYVIARTWTATDACGLKTPYTQIITLQDNKAPIPATTFEEIVNVSCTDIPEAPALTFTDNCSSASNIIVVFNETSTFQDNVYNDYEVVRTWTVRDECGNEAEYKQTINVALDELITSVNAPKRCFDDGIINLDDELIILISDINTNGTWELIEGNPVATLSGGIFNPTLLELSEDFLPDDGGIDYMFKYTTTDNGCIKIVNLTMNINADCKVLPCGENDVIISKAVTPNGDFINDFFYITGIDLCGFVAEVKIFNRWGALIFESDSYPSVTELETRSTPPAYAWTGNASKNSVGAAGKVPNGTYYYIVTLKDSGLAPFTGPVYLGTK